jgi:hypothetical protein
MGQRFVGLILMASAAALVGCGGGGGSGNGDASTGDASGDSTTTPTGPVVLEVTPADGDMGVLTDAYIIIRFSRAMDTASVHAAFSSDDFVLADTGVVWNAENDTLTISGSGILEYAEGGSPEDVTANSYSFALATTATDADGDPLQEALAVTFATARHILAAPPLVEEHTGTVGSVGVFVSDAVLQAGDHESGAGNFHGLMTFDLTEVPGDILAVTQATISMRQAGVAGDPFGTLGSLYFEHVSFGDLTADAFDTSHLSFVDDDLPDTIAYAVPAVEAVENDLENRVARQNRSQFRLRFSSINNGDDVADLLQIVADSPALDLRYLIE